MITAWHAARYVWSKELPDLAAELSKGRRKRGGLQQTNEELIGVMQGLSAQLGIPLKRRPRTKES